MGEGRGESGEGPGATGEGASSQGRTLNRIACCRRPRSLLRHGQSLPERERESPKAKQDVLKNAEVQVTIALPQYAECAIVVGKSCYKHEAT